MLKPIFNSRRVRDRDPSLKPASRVYRLPKRDDEVDPWQWDDFFHADDLRGILHQPKGESL
mgnify:CR=1 FL=1